MGRIFLRCEVVAKSPVNGRFRWNDASYPLVMTKVANWKMAIYTWFSHEKWWFSIAMLIYQRVHILWMVAKSCKKCGGFIPFRVSNMFQPSIVVQDFATMHSMEDNSWSMLWLLFFEITDHWSPLAIFNGWWRPSARQWSLMILDDGQWWWINDSDNDYQWWRMMIDDSRQWLMMENYC